MSRSGELHLISLSQPELASQIHSKHSFVMAFRSLLSPTLAPALTFRPGGARPLAEDSTKFLVMVLGDPSGFSPCLLLVNLLRGVISGRSIAGLAVVPREKSELLLPLPLIPLTGGLTLGEFRSSKKELLDGKLELELDLEERALHDS